MRQFRQRPPHLRFPLVRDHQRQQVRLRKVAIVVGELLGAHSVGALLAAVPKARLLVNRAAAVHDLDLPLDLVSQGLVQEAERIQILDFRLSPKYRSAGGTHAHVGVAAQASLLHVAVGNIEVEQQGLQARQVLKRFIGTCADPVR